MKQEKYTTEEKIRSEGVINWAQEIYSPKPIERNFYSAKMATSLFSYFGQTLGAAMAVALCFGFFGNTFWAYAFSALVLSLEFAKRIALKSMFVQMNRKKVGNETYFLGLSIIASFVVIAISIATTTIGGAYSGRFFADKSNEIEQGYSAKEDSVNAIYTSKIQEAKKDKDDFFRKNQWKGSVVNSARPEYNRLSGRIGVLEEQHEKAVMEVRNEQSQTISQNNEDKNLSWWIWMCIGFGIELLTLACLYGYYRIGLSIAVEMGFIKLKHHKVEKRKSHYQAEKGQEEDDQESEQEYPDEDLQDDDDFEEMDDEPEHVEASPKEDPSIFPVKAKNGSIGFKSAQTIVDDEKNTVHTVYERVKLNEGERIQKECAYVHCTRGLNGTKGIFFVADTNQKKRFCSPSCQQKDAYLKRK